MLKLWLEVKVKKMEKPELVIEFHQDNTENPGTQALDERRLKTLHVEVCLNDTYTRSYIESLWVMCARNFTALPSIHKSFFLSLGLWV